MSPYVKTAALIAVFVALIAGVVSAPARALDLGASDSLTLVYDVRVTFLMAANMGEPDHASAEGEGKVLINLVTADGREEANASSEVRVRIDYRDFLDLFSSLNRTWSKELRPGELIILNETGMNSFLSEVMKEARPGLVVEREANLSEWGGRPALELSVRVSNNESRPEYLMLYRISINTTYYYDLSTGHLLESSVRYWVITSRGPLQVYINGTAEYRLSNPEKLPSPGKAKTYWFRVGYDLGKVVISWEGEQEPKAALENGEIVVGGGGSRVMSVAVLSPYEPRMRWGGMEVRPATYPLSPPWGSFTIATVGSEELRIAFDEGVNSVSDSPPNGGGFPPYITAVAAGVVAVAGVMVALFWRRNRD